jgi:hypothetical protein
MDRKTSRFTVKVFDPNRDPSVAEMLKAEMAKDARVTGIRAPGKFAMVTTAKGTFWLDDEGVGDTRSIETQGCPVQFYRTLTPNHFEVIPFATAKYSLDECKACVTGEEVTLDKFIGYGRRKDGNFEQWEAALEKADKQ